MDNLTLRYGHRTIVSDLSFAITEGDFLVLIGENGVGKTTLVRALLGLKKPAEGEIHRQAGLQIGYVPQFRNLDAEYPLSVADFVALNLPRTIRPWINRKERQQLHKILDATSLTEIADRPMGLASGGEKQRAYLAQALLNDPQLLIMDESTASLDNDMKFDLLDLVAKFQQNNLSVLFVTHDWELAKRYGTRYFHLERGGRFSQGPINELPSELEEDD